MKSGVIMASSILLGLASCSEKRQKSDASENSREQSNAQSFQRRGATSDDLVHRYFSKSADEILADVKSESDPAMKLAIIQQAAALLVSWDDFLKICDEIENLDIAETKKLPLLQGALATASRQGFTKESLDFLNSTLGPGGKREGLVSVIFANAKGPLAEFAKMARRLETNDEVSIAISSLSSSIAASSTENIMEFSNAVRGDRELTRSLGAGIGEKISREGNLEANALKNLQKLVHLNSDENEFVIGLLGFPSESVHQMIWPEFLEKGSEWGSSRSAFLRSAATRSPAETFGRLSEWPHSQPDDIGIVVQTWLRSDPISATREIGVNKQLAASPSLHSAAALEIVQYAVSYNDIQSARSWAELITDPRRKAKALDVINKQTQKNGN